MPIEHDENAAIGIDLIIMYIATIIMVAVISATMIEVVEGLGQQYQHTAADATKSSATQIVVVGAWVEDQYDDFLFMVEYQGQGKEVSPADVGWVLWCTENGNLHYRSGTLDDWISGPPFGSGVASIWKVGDEPTNTATELIPGERYFFGIDGGTNAAAAGSECGPVFLANNNIDAHLTIHFPNGGSSTQLLQIDEFITGYPVI
jgi:hypothetical protein